MQEIELELKAEEEEAALRPPAVKKQNVILLSVSDKLADALKSAGIEDLVGWVAQIPEDDDISTTPSRIHAAAHEFNTTPKGIRMPVETVGEACEVVSAKFFKEQAIWIKSKTPLLIVRTGNKIPMEVSE